jgi:hypothetical protein
MSGGDAAIADYNAAAELGIVPNEYLSDVRYWHLADVDRAADQCPLSGVKRTTCARDENFHL